MQTQTQKTYRDYSAKICIGRNWNMFYVIVLFDDNPLREVQMVKISDLESIAKHSKKPLKQIPPLHRWEEREKDKLFTVCEKTSNLSVGDLIEHCEGVRLWFKEYHPELIV